MSCKHHGNWQLTILLFIMLSLISFLPASRMSAKPQPQPPASLSDGEYRSKDLDIKNRAIEVEMKKALSDGEYRSKDLDIKNRAIEVEMKKAWISALVTAIPILVGLSTLIGTIMAAKKTVVAQFTTKAAELALQGEGPVEVINRANLLAKLYKDLLPTDFVERVKALNAREMGRIVTQAPWTSNLQKEVVTVLAENPAQRNQIIDDYISMFPSYEFLKKLKKDSQNPTDTSSPQSA